MRFGLKTSGWISYWWRCTAIISSIDAVAGPIQSGVSPEYWTTPAKEINMTVQKQIKEYVAAQPEPKRSEMQELHGMILALMPACKLWFLDGKDEKGKIVSNPNIGYGSQTMEYANGKTREFYQIGVSANTTGISVYIMGLEDKKYLAQTFGRDLGKASVTGYCIKFKKLADIKVDVLKAAIQYGIGQTSTGSDPRVSSGPSALSERAWSD
jgi:Domain of unknown function (DU1801)